MAMRSLSRLGSPLLRTTQQQERGLATFAELYRKSVSNAIVRPGDPLVGQVVGQQRGKTRAKQRFFVVDFGLKNEAPFASREIPGASRVGARVALPLVTLEDAFNEPALDYSRRTALPALTAERLGLWTRLREGKANLVHGRFATIKRGGASVKTLGVDAFAPRHHVVALARPLLGSFAPFYVLSVSAPPPGRGAPDAAPDLQPVVSSYGGYLFALAKLVGDDAAWAASGGGSARERIAYLRLLTRLLAAKNVSVRRLLPRASDVLGHAKPPGARTFPRPYRPHSVNRRSGAWLDGMQTVDGKKQRVVQLGPNKFTPKTKQ